MSDDLISREALRRAMYHEAMEKDSDEQKWDSGCWIRYKMFERVLEAQPCAERRGKWEFIGGYGYQYRCSVCITCAEHKTHYCPNCGAKMETE